MDVKLASPFLESVFNILPQIGLQDIKRGNLGLKDNLHTSLDVTAVIGLSGNIKGNATYSMNVATAINLASKMMMGMEVGELDAMAQSAIAELANMLVSNTVALFEKQNILITVSPPTLVVGENVTIRISQVQSLAVEVLTEDGLIEVNIGLEV